MRLLRSRVLGGALLLLTGALCFSFVAQVRRLSELRGERVRVPSDVPIIPAVGTDFGHVQILRDPEASGDLVDRLLFTGRGAECELLVFFRSDCPFCEVLASEWEATIAPYDSVRWSWVSLDPDWEAPRGFARANPQARRWYRVGSDSPEVWRSLPLAVPSFVLVQEDVVIASALSLDSLWQAGGARSCPRSSNLE